MTDVVTGRLPYGGTLPRPIPDAVQAALGDGEVDFDETMAAARATVACLRDRGVEATDPAASAGGRFVDYTWGPRTQRNVDPAPAADAAETAYGDCYARHQALVDEAWLRQTAVSEEARQLLIDDIAECLRAAGIDVADGTPEVEVFATLRPESTKDQLACASLHREELVVPDDGQSG